jgi:hypothetical protein
MMMITALQRLRQEEGKFKASLGTQGDLLLILSPSPKERNTLVRPELNITLYQFSEQELSC